jgi:hypothetical protein
MERETIVTDNTRGPTNKGYQLRKCGFSAEVVHIEPLTHTARGRQVGLRAHYHDTNAATAVGLCYLAKALSVPLLGWPRASRREHNVGLPTAGDSAHSLRRPLSVTLWNPKISPRRVVIRIETEPLDLVTRHIVQLVFNQIDRPKNVVNPNSLRHAMSIQKAQRGTGVSNTLRNTGELKEERCSGRPVKGIGNIKLTFFKGRREGA